MSGLDLAALRPEAAGQVFTIAGAGSVPAKEFFGHYFRMLGRRGPVCLPTSLAVAAASAAGSAERLRGRRTELNAASMRYLARPGGYSIDKARRLLGYEPRIDLNEGMRRTEAWLREQRLL